MLRSQRHAQVLLVSTLKRKLNDLETKETEEIRQLELEHSLLGGELEAEKELILKVTIEKTTNVIIRVEFFSIGVINVSNKPDFKKSGFSMISDFECPIFGSTLYSQILDL